MNPGAWWACRSPRELGIEPLAAGGAAGGDRLAVFVDDHGVGAEAELGRG